MANTSNLARAPLRPVARLLTALARYGSPLLAAAIFGGVLIPPLAHLCRPAIPAVVVLLMTLVLLRTNFAATFAVLRRPVGLAAMVAFLLLACPVIAWAAVRPLGLDPGITDGVVIFATGCAITTSPAFARMVDLDAELTLVGTLATTLLVPLTAPPMAYWLMGVDLALSLGALMGRLALMVVLPLGLALLIRRLAGEDRVAAHSRAIDGAVVLLLVLFGFGVMDGMAARILTDPLWVALALAAAFVADFGLNLLSTLAFAWMGWRPAASVGLISGNRNMALYLAVLPPAADPRIGLFFALCQVPLFLSPFLLRPLYRRLIPPPRA